MTGTTGISGTIGPKRGFVRSGRTRKVRSFQSRKFGANLTASACPVEENGAQLRKIQQVKNSLTKSLTDSYYSWRNVDGRPSILVIDFRSPEWLDQLARPDWLNPDWQDKDAHAMLVLSRKPGEALVLPSINAKFTILEIKGRSVRIGIEAPDGVRIMRSELLLSLDGDQAEVVEPAKSTVNEAVVTAEPTQQACLCAIASA